LHCLQFSDVPYTKEVLHPPGRTRPDSPILDHSKWLWCNRKGHTYTPNRVCNKKDSIQQHKPILNMGPLVAFFILYYTICQILPNPALWVLCHSSQAPYQIDVLHPIINVKPPTQCPNPSPVTAGMISQYAPHINNKEPAIKWRSHINCEKCIALDFIANDQQQHWPHLDPVLGGLFPLDCMWILPNVWITTLH
jgi:hypothetical protein